MSVDPLSAPAGPSFVIHQHHATRLHFDLRLEMRDGKKPVLVSWAVPKNLPRRRGGRALAIHVDDHDFGYGTFSGTIPEGYGAGEVRIFDSGTYEVVSRTDERMTFKLIGARLKGIWHLVKTDPVDDAWLVINSEWHGDPPEQKPKLEPMLATLESRAFDDDGWVFEPKWDGVRAISECSDEVRIISRNKLDITAAYPELRTLSDQLVAIDAILDGEIVAMEDGRPSFERLQSRMHVRDQRQIKRLMSTTPVTYVVFDLLYLDGRDLTARPLEERRAALEQVVVPTDNLQVSTSIHARGEALFEAARKSRLEGIVAKRLGSRYHGGKRSRDWLKIKTVLEADVVVAGWTPGEGSRSGKVGALVVGVYEADALMFCGSVGTGFTDKKLEEVFQLLDGLGTDSSAFDRSQLAKARAQVKSANWVRPELVAVVEFRELTGGNKLRAPSFKGFRQDKLPEACTLEDLRKVAKGE